MDTFGTTPYEFKHQALYVPGVKLPAVVVTTNVEKAPGDGSAVLRDADSDCVPVIVEGITSEF
ncbi:MAG TPA: hypothetical protein VHZ07_18205 [Bryobacteraceae bacterium]|jgi:hypothetical protein|nr:hypothetical protein [Bryobacteraceae bacterium]